MRCLFVSVMALLFIGLGCDSKTKDEEVNDKMKDSLWNGFTKVCVEEIGTDLFKIHNEWALVTAGIGASYNTMTISWGGFATLWNKPVVFVFIRDNRYTFQFMEREKMFTVEFFNDEYRKALEICGTKSGRDGNKVVEAGLIPIATPAGSMAFEQGNMIIECRKMYGQMLDDEQLEAVDMSKFYSTDKGIHKMYVGEIINVWKKE